MHKWLHTHQYLKVSELNEMYMSISLRSFAIALFGMFIPAILLSYGYSFIEVIFYYLVFAIVYFIAFIFAIELMSFKGVKHVMLYSIPFFIILLIGLYTLEYVKWDYFFLASLHGVFSAFFWSAFHIELSTYTHTKKSGREIGLVNLLSQSFAILGPLLGGIILAVSGPKFIAITCICLILFSGVPLLLTKDHNLKIQFRWFDMFHGFNPKRKVAFISEGVRHFASLVLWPLFLALSGIGFLGIGALYTVVRVITIITSVYVGRASDRVAPKKLMRAGTYLHSLSMVIRGFLETAASLTAVTSIGGLGFILFNVPMQKIWYNHAKESGPLYILRREMYVSVGRISILFCTLGVFWYTQNALFSCLVTFIIGAIATLALNFLE